MMTMLRKRHGVELLSATTLTLVSLVCFTFVDDTNLPITGRKHSTGEELAPIKSWCYLINHVWTGTKWRYRTKEEMPGEFTLTDRHGVCHVIDRLEPSVGKETLGVILAPNGNQKAQGTSLTERFLRENKIQPMHGRHSYVYVQRMFSEKY